MQPGSKVRANNPIQFELKHDIVANERFTLNENGYPNLPGAEEGSSNIVGVRQPVAGSSGLSDGPLPAHVCDICGRSFNTARGLGVHRVRLHPLESHQAVDTDRQRPRWSDEEVRLMARYEAGLMANSVEPPTAINQSIQNEFPDRSIEAIKGRRKRQDYKELVARFLQEIQDERNAVPPTTVNSPTSEALKRAVEELSLAISQLGSPRANQLVEIANKVILGHDVSPDILNWLKSHLKVLRKPRGPAIGSKAPEIVGNSREKKRRRYAVLQGYFRKGFKVGARALLDDTWLSGREGPSDERVFDHWSSIFQQPSKEYTCTRPGVDSGLSNIWEPITVDELSRADLDITTSPGLDGISARSWVSLDPRERALLYNIFMYMGKTPSELLLTRTVFIPKNRDGPVACDQLRPISIGSVVTRQFHKVLANRLTLNRRHDPRQRGFLPRDGVGENLFVLSSILDRARRGMRELHMATLDLTKAFDTLSHKAIIAELGRKGCHEDFVNYVDSVYRDGKTVLQIRTNERTTQVCQGVKQGDPMSPAIFNLVLESALEVLDSDVGFEIHGSNINALAYADDIILISSTRQGLQKNLRSFQGAIENLGMSINYGKSGTLSLVPAGKEKRIKVLDTPWAYVGGNPLKAISVVEQWKYLGIDFQGARLNKNPKSLANCLDTIDKAPLKPQQKVAVVREYLIPRFLHTWVLGRVTGSFLKMMDNRVRAYLRKWLHLPTDVALGAFYAPVKSGGLGMPKLQEQVPTLLLQRLSRSRESPDVVVSRCCDELFTKELSKHNGLLNRLGHAHWGRAPATVNNQVDLTSPGRSVEMSGVVRDNNDINVPNAPKLTMASRAFWGRALLSKTDGRDLVRSHESDISTFWIKRGYGLSGADYVRFVKLRLNALPSRVRTLRGRSGDRGCRAGCSQTETNYHIVQTCHRTHGGRIKRHDRVVSALQSKLGALGYSAYKEHIFQTSVGIRKPDLIVVKEDHAIVLDVQITSERNISLTHQAKKSKYRDIPSFTDLVGATFDCTTVSYEAVTISWKGIFERQSLNLLKDLKIPKRTLARISLSVMRGSYMCWQRFNRMTSRADDR